VRVSDIITRATGGRRGLATISAVAVMLALTFPGTALAADVFVTTTADRVDGNVASIMALNDNKGGDGAISLREAALAAANEVTPASVVLGNSQTYVLAGSDTTVSVGLVPEVAGGALRIRNFVTIVGNSSIITRSIISVDRDGLIDIDPGMGSNFAFTAQSLTLAYGWAEGPYGGGALRAGDSTDTTTPSSVTLTDCMISNNRAAPSTATASSGGAISIGQNTALTISGCTVTRNTAEGVGGALFVSNTGAGGLTITNSRFTDNLSDGTTVTAGQGGAVYARVGSGGGTITGSTFTGNTATSGGSFGPDTGGALFVGGTFAISDNRITNNVADTAPGAFGFLGMPVAENNWWGTNAHPLSGSPAPAAGVDADPRMKLTATPVPASVLRTESATITAEVGSTGGHVPPADGSMVGFSGGGALGSMSPTGRILVSGVATSTFTSTHGAGIATVVVQYDNASVTTTVSVLHEPEITASSDVTFTVGSVGQLNVSAFGYPIPSLVTTSTLPTGLTFAGTGVIDTTSRGARLSGTPAVGTGGRYKVTLVATNGVAPDDSAELTVTVVEKPRFTSAAATTVTAGTSGSFSVTTSGYPVAEITAGMLPAGLTLTDNGDGTADIAGTPTADGGIYAVTLTADNGVSTPTEQILTIAVRHAPVFTPAAGDVTFTVGTSGTATFTALGYPAPGVGFRDPMPSGLAFSLQAPGVASHSGTISGTPAAGTGGRYLNQIAATSSVGPPAVADLTITINEAAAFTSADVATFTAGTAGEFDIATSGYPTATISALDPLPSGLTLADNGDGTARISGTPGKKVSGVFPIRLQADNGVGTAGAQTLTITIVRQVPEWSYRTFTWDLQQDFEHNASTTGEATTINGVATALVPGSVVLPSIVAIATGRDHTVGLRSDGTVVAVGTGVAGQIFVSDWTDITAISAGWYHTVGLRSDGTVVATGYNANGQCNVSDWTDITAIWTGAYHTVGLKSDGTLVATGLNDDGQCNVSAWTDITAASAGVVHTVGLKSDGTVVATGSNADGECGVSGWTDITAIAAGGLHTVGLRSDGTVVAAGSNGSGQCGVAGWTDITAISAGAAHTVGLQSDGTPVAAGFNGEGQCNISGWTDITAVWTGAAHTVGLQSDGTLVATGYNYWGQCDIGDWTAGSAVLIGGSGSAAGLRAIADPAAFAGWNRLTATTAPLRLGEAVKFAVRLSGDGVAWSEPLGRDGQPIDWDTGTGNYLGRAATDAAAFTDLSAIPHSRYIDVVVWLESANTFSPELKGVSVTYDRDDLVAPTVTHDAPAGWVTVAPTVTVTATDTISGVASLDCVAAGPGGGPGVLTTETATFAITADGVTTFTYSAIDEAGNRSATQTVDVKVDGKAPDLQIAASPSAVWLTATDDVSGVASTWYRIDGGAPQLYTGMSFSPGASGRHTITAWTLDVAGNITVDTTDVLVDTEAPVVSDNAPTGWRTSDVTVTVSANDADSAVAAILMRITPPTGLSGLAAALGTETAQVAVTDEGTTTIEYSAVDSAANQSATETAIVRIDKTAPESGATHATGWVSGPVSVTLASTDTVSGIDSIWYRTAPAGGWTRYTGAFDVTEPGTTTVTFWAADIAGNSETPKTTQVFVDEAAPTVSDNAPAGWQTADFAVDLTATDPLSGVVSLTYATAGASGPSAATVVGSAASVPVTAEGTTTITYSAIDIAGNRCATETATVYLDKTAPVTTPSHLTGWQTGAVTVTLDATDASSGVARTWYRIGGGGATIYSGPFSVSTSAETTVTFWSEDVAGNAETPGTTVVRVDDAAPTVSDDAPAGWSTGDVGVNLTAHDTVSGVASIAYALGGAGGTLSDTVTGAAANVLVTAEGTTTIEYSAVDNAGNRSATNTATVRIDKVEPSTSAFHAAGWSNTSVSVELNAQDAVSGVANTWYRIGSGGATLYTGPFSIGATGETTVTFWSVDVAGNKEAEQETVVRVDPTAPVTESDADAGYLVGVGGTIHLTATDADSGVASTRWRLGSGAAVEGTSVAVPTVIGTYVLQWSSTDFAGNVETTRQATFTVAAKAVVRIGGDDRYDVAVGTARRGWDPEGNGEWPGVKHVILACGETGAEADPLSAAGLAGIYDAPVLLVRSASMPPSTRSAIIEMAENNPGLKVHIVGGTGSVPDARFTELKSIPGINQTADRLAGADRYAVSVNIAKRIVSVETTDSIGGVLLICAENPSAFFDALAAGPIAYARHMPLVAVRTASMPAASGAFVASMKAAGKTVYSVSGPTWIGAVPAAGATRLTTSSNIYTAASDIATRATAEHWLTPVDVGLSAKLPDAMTGGTFMGKQGGVMLFTDSAATMQPASSTFLTANKAAIVRGWIFGGIASVQPSVHTSFKNLIQ